MDKIKKLCEDINLLETNIDGHDCSNDECCLKEYLRRQIATKHKHIYNIANTPVEVNAYMQKM